MILHDDLCRFHPFKTLYIYIYKKTYKHIIIDIINHRDIPTIESQKHLPTGAAQDWRWSFRRCIARCPAFLPSWFSDMGQGPRGVMVGRGSLGVANSWASCWNSSEFSSWNGSDAFKFLLFEMCQNLIKALKNRWSFPKNIVRCWLIPPNKFPQGEPYVGKPWVFCLPPVTLSHQPLHAHRHFLVGGLEHFFPYIGNNNPNWLIFLEHEFYLSIYWEFHHPNWRTHIFRRLNEAPSSLSWQPEETMPPTSIGRIRAAATACQANSLFFFSGMAGIKFSVSPRDLILKMRLAQVEGTLYIYTYIYIIEYIYI